MAAGAIPAKLAVMRIVLSMAAHALLRSPLELPVDVAGQTVCRRVYPEEDKICKIMVK